MHTTVGQISTWGNGLAFGLTTPSAMSGKCP